MGTPGSAASPVSAASSASSVSTSAAGAAAGTASPGAAGAPLGSPSEDSRGIAPEPLPPYLDSFNTLLLRHFRDMQDSRTFHNDLLRRLKRKFGNIERPGWLGQIVIQELDVGHKMAEFHNIKIMPTLVANELVRSCVPFDGRLPPLPVRSPCFAASQIGETDMLYEGGAGITIATEIYVNWPKNKFATVPLVASLRVTHLSGKLYLYGPPDLQGRFSLSFAELPNTKFDVDMRIGEKEVRAPRDCRGRTRRIAYRSCSPQVKVLKLPRLKDWLISTFHKVPLPFLLFGASI